jgi:hypothetical protein
VETFVAYFKQISKSMKVQYVGKGILKKIYGIPDIIRAIDGLHIPISCPNNWRTSFLFPKVFPFNIA